MSKDKPRYHRWREKVRVYTYTFDCPKCKNVHKFTEKEWQDMDNTFIEVEKVMSVRIDCIGEQLAAA